MPIILCLPGDNLNRILPHRRNGMHHNIICNQRIDLKGIGKSFAVEGMDVVVFDPARILIVKCHVDIGLGRVPQTGRAG